MVEPSKPRAHGQTAAEEEAKERGKEIEKILDHEPEDPVSLTRAFQRMRTDWNSKDRETIIEVKSIVDEFMFERFPDAYEIEYEIWNIVRAKRIDPKTGEVMVDQHGLDLWETRPDGSYVEDWSNIGIKERERLLYEIITRLFTWEQRLAEIKGEALFAKAVWEEAFATGFDTADSGKKTVEARNARGTRVAMEHRYLAVYKSMCYERAAAIVRSMDRLAQRLKDIHTA